MKHLSKVFGGLVAINKLNQDIERGKITAIIGHNGAGKTTLFNIITGVYAPSEGTLVFDGRALCGSTSCQRVQMDIARTFQNVLFFQDMTVLENVMIGRYAKTGSGFMSNGLRLPGMRREEEDILLDATHFLNLVEQRGGRHNSLLRQYRWDSRNCWPSAVP